MNAAERDALLARLDERSTNTWNSVEKIEKHLGRLNETVAENSTGVAVNKSGLKRVYWLMGGSGLIIVGGIVELVRRFLQG